MHIMGATWLNSQILFHGLFVTTVIIGIVVSFVILMKYFLDPISKENFSYLLKEEPRPQTTHMHRLSIDLQRFWRTRIKDKSVSFTVFCHKDVPHSLLIEPLPVYEIVNSLIGRAFYRTKTGRIHLHVTYDAKTPKHGVLTIIVANTGNGSLSPIFVGQSETYKIFDLEALVEDVERTHGNYSYKTATGRGTEFIITIPADIYFPPKQKIDNHDETHVDPLENRAATDPSVINPLNRTLQDMGQVNIAAMKPIQALKDDHMTLPHTGSETAALEPEIISSMKEQDVLDLDHNMKIPSPAPKPQHATPLAALNTDKGIEKIKFLDVLIAEDVSSNRETIRAMLEPLEHNIFFAQNGQEALDILATRQFDYIIMDIHMPGLNGIEASKIIRQSQQSYANIPIIALTADTTLETAHNGLGVGIDMVLTKPTTSDVLFEAIKVAVESRLALHLDQSNLSQKSV